MSTEHYPYQVCGVISRLCEHKSAYQTNMLLAMSIVTLLGILVFGAEWIRSYYSRPDTKSNVVDVASTSGHPQSLGDVASRRPRSKPGKIPRSVAVSLGLPASGYIRNIRIVSDPVLPDLHTHRASSEIPGPESGQFNFDSDISGSDPGYFPGTGYDDGLPPAKPMWSYTRPTRGASGLSGSDTLTLMPWSTPPHAMLASPVWPRDAEFLCDSAVVEGFITLHNSGLVSFELTGESHRKIAFADAVVRAIRRSTCYPARDLNGERISVRYRYRCLFARGSEPSVAVSSDDPDRPFDGTATASTLCED